MSAPPAGGTLPHCSDDRPAGRASRAITRAASHASGHPLAVRQVSHPPCRHSGIALSAPSQPDLGLLLLAFARASRLALRGPRAPLRGGELDLLVGARPDRVGLERVVPDHVRAIGRQCAWPDRPWLGDAVHGGDAAEGWGGRWGGSRRAHGVDRTADHHGAGAPGARASGESSAARPSTAGSRPLPIWAWPCSCCSSEQAPSFSRPTLRSNGSVAASNVASTPRFGADAPVTGLSDELLSDRNFIRTTLDRRWKAAVLAGRREHRLRLPCVALCPLGRRSRSRPSLVVLAYASAELLAQIPFTPGGLGFVEGVWLARSPWPASLGPTRSPRRSCTGSSRTGCRSRSVALRISSSGAACRVKKTSTDLEAEGVEHPGLGFEST